MAAVRSGDGGERAAADGLPRDARYHVDSPSAGGPEDVAVLLARTPRGAAGRVAAPRGRSRLGYSAARCAVITHLRGIKALAKQIESAQTAEVTHIQELLTTI